MIIIKHIYKIIKRMIIMDSKGIFNIELFISLMVLIIIFSMIISFSIQEYTSMEETQNRRQARITVMDIYEVIMDVYTKGNGFSRKYKLPTKINSQTYILQINGSGVYLNSHNQVIYSEIPPQIINESKKYNLKPGYVYEFFNNNDTIIITKNN